MQVFTFMVYYSHVLAPSCQQPLKSTAAFAVEIPNAAGRYSMLMVGHAIVVMREALPVLSPVLAAMVIVVIAMSNSTEILVAQIVSCICVS